MSERRIKTKRRKPKEKRKSKMPLICHLSKVSYSLICFCVRKFANFVFAKILCAKIRPACGLVNILVFHHC